MLYRFAADLILVLHALFVAFVVLGQLSIVLGLAVGWRWVRHIGFRLAHLVAIGFVVVQAWIGVICPLTHLENWLRRGAGEGAYAGSFIQHWLHRLIFYEAEPWVFTLVYSLFGALVLATWVLGPPRRKSRKDKCRM